MTVRLLKTLNVRNVRRDKDLPVEYHPGDLAELDHDEGRYWIARGWAEEATIARTVAAGDASSRE